jgi:hypothetical protein
MKLIKLFIFTFIAINTHASEDRQEDSNRIICLLDFPKDSMMFRGKPHFKAAYEEYYKYKNAIKFAPLKPFHFSYSQIEFGYERMMGMRFVTEISTGIILPKVFMKQSEVLEPKNKGFTFSIEERFFLTPPKRRRVYLAFEFNYRKINSEHTASFGTEKPIYDSIGLTLNYLDTFQLKKQLFNYSVKFGFQFTFDRVFFDMYAGIGLRYRQGRHSDRMHPFDELENSRHPTYDYSYLKEGFYFLPNVVANIRIGYRF